MPTSIMSPGFQSEIRQSDINQLLERIRNRNYEKYLLGVTLERVRGFHGEDVTFDFPVTALVGPNGGGKTTILGAAALAYNEVRPRRFFAKSGRFDLSMQDWRIAWHVLDRAHSNAVIDRAATFKTSKWYRDAFARHVQLFGVTRTVPANERTELQRCISNTFTVPATQVAALTPEAAKAAARILGKDVAAFSHVTVDPSGRVSFLTGVTAAGEHYSEFHFGAGESSIIRMVMAIEAMPDQSLVLIEEIENGLHPVATARMVEYLISIAQRKRAQAVFTTHSNDALRPLPPEAIWASIRWKTFRGKLDVHALRAIEGTVEAELAIFVEDDFAAGWIAAMLRIREGFDLDALQVHALSGDSMAVSVNKFHNADPSSPFPSICYVDGDSQQADDGITIFRLPGQSPELYVYDRVVDVLDDQAGVLAVALHRRYEEAKHVAEVVRDVRMTNQDPHVLFSQVGRRLGLIPEATVRDGFLSIWAQAYTEEALAITEPIGQKMAGGVGMAAAATPHAAP